VRYAADWAQRRRGADKGDMNRVHIAETRFSITGSVADNRLAVDPSRIHVLARALAHAVGVAGVGGDEKLSELEKAFVERAAADLKNAKGAGVVAVGESASPAVHALGHAINQQIAAVGNAATLIADPAGDRETHQSAITKLGKQMAAGEIGTLLILGGNPAYDAPIDVDFANALAKVHVTIRLGLYEDETSRLCHWHLPRAHYLESWGDARAWDGSR
jgi:molybdopterin-containing oxidoreductase family iron-sulfur binding subunit